MKILVNGTWKKEEKRTPIEKIFTAMKLAGGRRKKGSKVGQGNFDAKEDSNEMGMNQRG